MSQASRRARSLSQRMLNDWELEEPEGTLSDVFSEEPSLLPHFVGSPDFLANPPLGPIQYDFVRHFEQILYPHTYVQMVEEFGEQWAPVRFVNELSAEWGKGGGKDHVCQISVARVSHLLLCLKDPQEYYGLAPQTVIHLLNVAVSAPQAAGVFFRPLRTLLTTSPWFSDKFEIEPSPQATEIHLKNAIDLVSGHSNADSLEGKNLLIGIADEISAFPTLSASKNAMTKTPAKTAEGIIEMLRSSATTRFPETFKLAQISYPRYKNDAIEQAMSVARADNKANGADSVYYASGPHPTWAVNPRYDRFPKVEAPGTTILVPEVKSILKDYEIDPAYARAKYECLPDLAEERFFRNDAAIESSFPELPEGSPLPLSFTYSYGLPTDSELWTSDSDSEFVSQPGWQVQFEFAPGFRPYRGALYAIHGDMAISGDRAGVSLCHVRDWQARDWERPMGDTATESRPIVKVDFVAAFEAAPAVETLAGTVEAREIQIRWFRALVWELSRRGFHIGSVTMDNFQSADTLQILKSRGIQASLFSTDRSNVGWDTLRDLMYDGRLEGYYDPVLVHEISALNRLRSGKVDHPPGGSKDMADALAGATVGALALGGGEGADPAWADEEGSVDLFSVGQPAGGLGSAGLDGSGLSASAFGM